MKLYHVVHTLLSLLGFSALFLSSGCGSAPLADPMSAETTALENPDGLKSATGSTVARARFEAASVVVPRGSTCTLHPEGNSDPAQAVPVGVDEDGVARFQAVRPTVPNAVDRLDLNCTDAAGNQKTYTVDLRSEATFAPRAFDASRTTLVARPPLAGDPLAFSLEELVRRGYGLRPDPKTNPDGYVRWLAAASLPVHKLRSALGHAATASAALSAGDAIDAGLATGQGSPWTGAVLSGSYQRNATSALTHSYVANEATFNVPSVNPGADGTGSAQISIWNGLGNDTLLQAEVWARTTSTAASYFIHHQCFAPNSTGSGNDSAGTKFTPNPQDKIYAEEWYCDAAGNLNLWGGYACTYMLDMTQGLVWDCDVASSADCPSYQLDSSDLANGYLGQQAEFIVENDTAELSANDFQWPAFSSITMSGSALVVEGSGVGGAGTWVTTTTDPSVLELTDFTPSNVPSHVEVSLPGSDSVNWTNVETNIYYWNGSNFNNYEFGCARSMAVGPSAFGSTNGTPWVVGCNAHPDGNYDVYELQFGTFVLMQRDVATQIAVSPSGIPWAINASGSILFWNGSAFAPNPTGGCATAIGVGPNSRGLTNGTPWVMGCDTNPDGNHGVWEMQTAGVWVEMQSDVGTQIAVSPTGIPWVVSASGSILYWNGSEFVANPTGGCATSIGVAPNSRGLTSGTPWVTGCDTSADGNRSVWQMQTGGAWVEMQSDVAASIAASPTGIAWVMKAAL